MAASPRNTVDLRRVYTMPARGVEAVRAVVLRPSRSDVVSSRSDPTRRLDRFGFILNMDSNGNIHELDPADSLIPTFAEASRNDRRLKQWNNMINKWPKAKLRRRRKLILKRVRKGIPDSVRGQVWLLLGDVGDKMKKNPGLYEQLVRETIIEREPQAEEYRKINHTKSFRNLQDTIERDIHRTFPRHSLFFDVDSADSIDSPEYNGVCGSVAITSMLRELEFSTAGSEHGSDQGKVPGGRLSPNSVLEARGGQASLRRMLKAYSLYDREIGYCQGMNFIAGMFLTLMSEEEAFWLLVGKMCRKFEAAAAATTRSQMLFAVPAVMYEEPRKMRGLFGEGMRETHKVLYVAEKLIHQFLPKLSKHFDREHIHVTMYATQWLLTLYSSSFQFDLVLRVWDCFLAEGWKITYRVMLSLLTQSQSALLKMGFEEILAFFRELPNHVQGATVIEASINIPLRRKHIAKYEHEWLAQQPKSPKR